MTPEKKKFPTLPLLLLATAIPALFLGARSAAAPHSRKATYAEILTLIEERHVPAADSKDVIYSSIHGMLGTLDPHTNFLDDEVYREMREEQRGHFFGLGIVISKRGRHEPLRVVAPIADTPAARLGVRSGDVITHIRDPRANVDIDTLGLTIQESVKHLRGPRGSKVEITIDRPGFSEPLILEIERDAVRTPAVNQAYMIRPGVAYVQISNFTETTIAELDRALERLGQQGARALVLDLQNNPGGLLDQAVGVASRFLEPGELVVYTEGRQAGSRQDYTAVREAPRVTWPMVVLIDAGSASASEIVAGAVQDHDRALIVGSTSFGKGLVQSVYPLSESSGLALTTQKYYSPTGRSIQRPYESEEEYYFEAAARSGTTRGPAPGAPVFLTETGRKVYGGGGITPDIPIANPEIPEPLVRLYRVSAFARFIDPLAVDERDRLLRDEKALIDRFTSFVTAEIEGVDTATLVPHRRELVNFLHAEIALTKGGLQERDRVLLERNPVVLRAIDALDEAEGLLAQRKATRLAQRSSNLTTR